MVITVYLISFALSMYALESINLEKMIKQNKVIEARLLYILMCFALTYLVANFMISFVEAAKF